jgi:hypothetical protein
MQPLPTRRTVIDDHEADEVDMREVSGWRVLISLGAIMAKVCSRSMRPCSSSEAGGKGSVESGGIHRHPSSPPGSRIIPHIPGKSRHSLYIIVRSMILIIEKQNFACAKLQLIVAFCI